MRWPPQILSPHPLACAPALVFLGKWVHFHANSKQTFQYYPNGGRSLMVAQLQWKTILFSRFLAPQGCIRACTVAAKPSVLVIANPRWDPETLSPKLGGPLIKPNHLRSHIMSLGSQFWAPFWVPWLLWTFREFWKPADLLLDFALACCLRGHRVKMSSILFGCIMVPNIE